MGKVSKEVFIQGRYTNGWQVHRVFGITSYQENHRAAFAHAQKAAAKHCGCWGGRGEMKIIAIGRFLKTLSRDFRGTQSLPSLLSTQEKKGDLVIPAT